ncbi:MAG: hypothetical protein IJQ28_03230 [Clostridia bacterium]|nr:hypothetical protein [Clostridia bacterium]
MITEQDLIFMMFHSKPISDFERIFKDGENTQVWEELLHMCYWEFSYESVGGDKGYLENPPINSKRLEYLENLIKFLEMKGIKAENTAPKFKRP